MSKNKKRTTIMPLMLLATVTLLLGCTRTFDNLDEYERYVKGDDWPYVQTVVRNGVRFTLRYMPTEAMMIRFNRHFIEQRTRLEQDTTLTELVRQARLSELKQELAETQASFERSLYFKLTLGYENGQQDLVYAGLADGYAHYSEWLQKLLFGLQEKIVLETAGSDEVPLDTYHMERSFGMSKDRKFLLMFPHTFNGTKVLNGQTLRLKLAEVGLGTGSMRFDFDLPFAESKVKIE